VFLRWSTGYRSGGYNGEIYNNPVEEETIEQWELGVKSDVLPGTLRVNASIFTYTYDDMQVGQIEVSPSGQPTSFTGNAGKAERWGSELELQWSPLDNLLVAASWVHLDGDFEEYPPQCGTGAYAGYLHRYRRHGPAHERGRRPALAGHGLGVRAAPTGPTSWRTSRCSGRTRPMRPRRCGPTTTPIERQHLPVRLRRRSCSSDRLIVNARIGIENVETSAGTLRAAIWGRNLTDEEYNTFGINFAGLGRSPRSTASRSPTAWT
jgi:iron complex outermembrane receptor protein